jgi:conjugative relaxase-like TrwC/TraI family protein
VISIRRVSLGGGFRYLMDSVAVGDGELGRSGGLSRYYAASGTPPGRFLGAGLADLDDGRGLPSGTEVSEEHLERMLVEVTDPFTGQPVGSTPRAPRGGLPVVGFDLTFSPSKSVSVAWALADQGTKEIICACHRQAVDYVLAWAETHVLKSRSGTNGIVEEDITGAVAAAFTHWASRADDPQLHDHVVVWNRARSVSDGRWRTLDSRALFKATTTLSELHQGVLSDLLTGALGIGWEARGRRHSSRPRYEITGVGEQLMGEFSQRATQIAAHHDRQVAEFVAAHGRQPSPVERMRLRQVATVATRPDKTHASLESLTDHWRQRAHQHVAACEQVAWVSGLAGRNDLPRLRADDLAGPILADTAEAALVNVAEQHATFSRMNLAAEAHRLLHGVRFAHPDDRTATAEAVTELAVERSVSLAPPDPHHTPARYRRPDGSSRLRPASRVAYTTHTLLDAEAHLLTAGRTRTGPTVPVATVARTAENPLPGRERRLGLEQAVAVEAVATSGRVLDVLVGPAGSGKSTTMAGLRAAWEVEHGPGSVIGLAPSAAAAEVLAGELGIDTDNTAKWLTEHRRLPELVARRRDLARRLERAHPRSAGAARLTHSLTELDQAIDARRLRPGQLVIVDEASLAGTFALDELVTAAHDAGAKILLAGDWAQLSAVAAGGALGLLTSDRGDLAPQLSDIRRFQHGWEKTASVQLRLGQETAIDAYQDHDRVTGGDRETLLDQLYTAWKADVDAGRTSLMIAGDAATVGELNARARTARVAAGHVTDHGLRVADGHTAGVADLVVTRENHRLLATGRRWVKNGDRWTVTATHDDGSMAVRRVDGTGEVVLPADYVTSHVELAYATTAHRAQGRTVDTAHAYITPTTTREVLYVAATRGRDTNQIYVDTSWDPDPATSHHQAVAPQTTAEVLASVLARHGADLSAHETRRRAATHAGSFAGLAAEYETLAAEAQRDRWDQLLERCPLTPEQLDAIRSSDAYGPLLAAFRTAESQGLDADAALPQLITDRTLAGADNPAAVVHHRVEQWAETAAARATNGPVEMIAGLVPRALHITDPDLNRALRERDQAMQTRARSLAAEAIATRPPWLRSLGAPPAHPTQRATWTEAVTTVAAYRDRWELTGHPLPLGANPPRSLEQLDQRRRAQTAVHRARQLTGGRDSPVAQAAHAPSSDPAPTIFL